MPTYAYQCALCKHTFEFFQHYPDDPKTVCPECGQPTLQKVYQVAYVHYKGNGFYVTDKYDPAKAG